MNANIFRKLSPEELRDFHGDGAAWARHRTMDELTEAICKVTYHPGWKLGVVEEIQRRVRGRAHELVNWEVS